MEQVNESIKKEFDDKLKSIEEIDNNKMKNINTLCYIATIFLFIAVLIGTIMSVTNYFEAKKKANEASEYQVVQLKKVN